MDNFIAMFGGLDPSSMLVAAVVGVAGAAIILRTAAPKVLASILTLASRGKGQVHLGTVGLFSLHQVDLEMPGKFVGRVGRCRFLIGAKVSSVYKNGS